MQIPTLTRKPFNRKHIENVLKQENKFITQLFSSLALPSHTTNDDDLLLQSTAQTNKNPKLSNKQTSRAKSLVELQERINQMTSKKGLTYKEKLLKKNLKAKLKKKNKGKKKLLKPNTPSATEMKSENTLDKNQVHDNSVKTEKMEFSRIDFSNIGKRKKKKEKQDPEKLLQDLRKQKTTLEELRESGDVQQASKIKEKQAWKNALARAQGVKIKDDEQLLVKSIKKDEQKRKQSKKKWEARIENVKKAQEDRQKKRQENIDKRKKTKKTNKIKKAVKRGAVVPGY